MEKNINYYEEELSLLEIYEIMKRNIGIIVAVTLGMALFAFLISLVLNFVKTPKSLYQAVTKIEVEVADANKKEQLLLAVAELMKGDTIVKKAMEKAKVTGEIETVRKNIEVRRVGSTNILEIAVNDEDQTKAKVLADEIRGQGISLVKNVLPLQEIKLIQETVILDDAVKINSRVNFKLNTVIGGVLGFMGIVFLIFLKYSLNDKILSEEEVKRYLGLKVLVSIPNYVSDSGIRRYFRIR